MFISKQTNKVNFCISNQNISCNNRDTKVFYLPGQCAICACASAWFSSLFPSREFCVDCNIEGCTCYITLKKQAITFVQLHMSTILFSFSSFVSFSFLFFISHFSMLFICLHSILYPVPGLKPTTSWLQVFSLDPQNIALRLLHISSLFLFEVFLVSVKLIDSGFIYFTAK